MKKGQKLIDCKNALYRDYDWFYLQYVTLGKTLGKISKEFDIPTGTLNTWLITHNIDHRNDKHYLNTKYRNYEWLYHQYIELDKSSVDIATDIHICTVTVLSWLKKFNIEKSKSCIAKKRWKAPFYRENKILHSPKLTGSRNGMYGKHTTEKQKKSVSKKLDKNPNWRGGKSFEPYCYKFNNKFKEYIRDKFNRRCFICGVSEKCNEKELNVHHIDYNKTSICNGKSWSFVPLCNKCHGKTNFNRWYWFNLLVSYWINDNTLNKSGDIYLHTIY